MQTKAKSRTADGVRAPSGKQIDPSYGVRVNAALARKYAVKAMSYADALPRRDAHQRLAGAVAHIDDAVAGVEVA